MPSIKLSEGHRWNADRQCVTSEIETRPEELLGKVNGVWAATSSKCSEQEDVGGPCPEQEEAPLKTPQESLGEAGRER